jgi:hypothetical protein
MQPSNIGTGNPWFRCESSRHQPGCGWVGLWLMAVAHVAVGVFPVISPVSKYRVEPLMHSTYHPQIAFCKELRAFVPILECLSICRQKSHVYLRPILNLIQY